MKAHRIYCGLASTVGNEAEMADLVRSLAIKHFGNGHTLIEATGRFLGITGPVDERTIIVEVWEVAGFDPPPVGPFSLDYKDEAKQEAVVIIETPISAVVL